MSLDIRLLRSQDYAGYVRVLLMPRRVWSALLALLALELELRAIPAKVNEPLVAQIRYQWWLDSIETIFQGLRPPAHPVIQALVEACKAVGRVWVKDDFAALLAAYESDDFHTAELILFKMQEAVCRQKSTHDVPVSVMTTALTGLTAACKKRSENDLDKMLIYIKSQYFKNDFYIIGSGLDDVKQKSARLLKWMQSIAPEKSYTISQPILFSHVLHEMKIIHQTGSLSVKPVDPLWALKLFVYSRILLPLKAVFLRKA